MAGWLRDLALAADRARDPRYGTDEINRVYNDMPNLPGCMLSRHAAAHHRGVALACAHLEEPAPVTIINCLPDTAFCGPCGVRAARAVATGPVPCAWGGCLKGANGRHETHAGPFTVVTFTCADHEWLTQRDPWWMHRDGCTGPWYHHPDPCPLGTQSGLS
jgi:hypothetical protein